MSQKKAKQLRQKVRRELGIANKPEKTSYETIKHKVKEMLKPEEKPRYFTTNVCTGLRGAYRKAKKGA